MQALPRSSVLHRPSREPLPTPPNTKMPRSLFLACLVLAFALLVIDVANASYKKPPFNGSIFGKRSQQVDYETAGKALSTMCEIASEACVAWFPIQDNNSN